jgi:alpha-glucosidase
MSTIGAITEFKVETNGVTLTTTTATACIFVLSPTVVRCRVSFSGDQPERNYAFQETVWEDITDPLFPARQSKAVCKFKFNEQTEFFELGTDKITVKFKKDSWCVEVADKDNNQLFSDLPQRPIFQDANLRLNHYFVREDSDQWFGLGEKTGPLDKTGRRYRMENTDAVGYAPGTADPLYKHIPFLIRAQVNNRFCGVFYNNAWTSEFDLGCTRSGYWGEFGSARFDGGDVDITYIAEENIAGITKAFTALTGKPPLMPRYSLGYLGSTMYYTELPERSDLAIQAFIDKCQRENIPVSGFHLSSGYTTAEDGKRYAFHWNEKRFPNPEGFIDDFTKQNLALSPNIKPGILSTHPSFKAMENNQAFILSDHGETHLEQFWGGQAALVDFTSEMGREAWKKGLKSALVSKGIYSIWNDNNEFEFTDTSATCLGDGLPENVNGMRPFLSNLMAKVAYDAIIEEQPNTRPFILSRAGFAGLQHWAHTWSGDNGSTWEYLRSNVTTMLNMSISGVPFNGMDIGGFTGPSPSPELFLRWVQSGIFHPRFCIHSANADNTVSEPWMHASVKPAVVAAMQFRYKLMPYLYQLAHRTHYEGAPITAPLINEFWSDKKIRDENYDFMLGDACFVPAVLEEGMRSKQQYFPKGSNFINPKTGKWQTGGESVKIETPLNEFYWYLREGKWIVLSRNTQEDEFSFLTSLTESSFSFFWDDGESFNYLGGDALSVAFELKQSENGFKLAWTTQGQLSKWTKSLVEFELFSQHGCPMSIHLNGEPLSQYLYEDEFQTTESGYWFNQDKQSIKLRVSAETFDKDGDIYLNFTNMIAVSI